MYGESKFIGINTNADGFYVRHVVPDEKGKCRAKESPVVLWVVLLNRGYYVMVPISKHDLETERNINYAQLVSACDSKVRTLVRKTKEGTEAYPYSAMFCK